MKQYVYNGTSYVLNEDVVGLSELPTPSAKYLDKAYLLTDGQTGYEKGAIYECHEVTPATDPKTYEWTAITGKFLETVDELPSVTSVEVGKQYFLSADTTTGKKGHIYENDGTKWIDITSSSKYKSISLLTMTGAKYQCITGLKLSGVYLIEIGYNLFIVRVLNNFGDQSQKKYGFEIELLGQNLSDTTNTFYNYPVYFNNYQDNALEPILAVYVSNGDRVNIQVTQISGVENNDFDFGTFYTSTPPTPFKKSTFYSAASMREAIAPLFNENKSYNVGDIVWKRVNTDAYDSKPHDNIELYRCIVAHSGAWNSTHFEKIQLCKDFKSGSKIFPGTMEEWNALTPEEQAKYDFVATPEEADEGRDAYSTTETNTGKTWIDGKPIYRKVIEKHVTLAGNSWNGTGIDVSEIDTLCNCVMLCAKYAFGGFYTHKASNLLNVYCVSDANWNIDTFVLEYTKTTD